MDTCMDYPLKEVWARCMNWVGQGSTSIRKNMWVNRGITKSAKSRLCIQSMGKAACLVQESIRVMVTE